jgi:hypothetical protein
MLNVIFHALHVYFVYKKKYIFATLIVYTCCTWTLLLRKHCVEYVNKVRLVKRTHMYNTDKIICIVWYGTLVRMV